ncbi:MAG: MarR family winged helix-turn-helix transcriptional regulator [Bacteroidota bacterium]
MDQVIRLLEYWKEFIKRGLGQDFENFGKWLTKETEREKEIPKDYESPNMTIGFLLGGLMGYSEVWTKMTFRNLPIQNFHDFGTLKFIEALKNPTKKEVAEDSLVEASTCFEAIKRLVKNGLLVEETDQSDKRVKRVRLTAEGLKVTDEATRQASLLSNLLVGDLSEEEKKTLIGILKKLDHFHEDLYRKTERDNIIEHYSL